MADDPTDVACALIERGGRLLVAKRPVTKSQALKWEFPGGKVEPGEDPRSALVREIAEELGVVVDVGRALAVSVHDYGAHSIRLIPFVCALHEGEPAPHEHEEVRWSTPGEIHELDLADADRPVLLSYVRSEESPLDEM